MESIDVLTGIAAVIERNRVALGLEGVSYPVINHVPASPWAMVRQSTVQPYFVEKRRAGLQVVSLPVDLVLLVASSEQRPGDAARLDRVIEPVLDLFDANANGGDVNHAFTGVLAESVDRIWQQARVRRLAMRWGESGYCHAAIITMDTQFQRKAVLP